MRSVVLLLHNHPYSVLLVGRLVFSVGCVCPLFCSCWIESSFIRADILFTLYVSFCMVGLKVI
jgi:hypothetical protein